MFSITAKDSTPPRGDEAVHLRDSLIFHNIFSDPSQITLDIVRNIINWSERYPLLRPSGYYPPLVPIVTSFLYMFFGTSASTAVMSNMIFLLILIFSIYKIGALIFERNVGLLACVFILLYPIVLQHSVLYMLDLPLTAMVALSIFTLVKSDYFKSTKYSLLLGFCFGLGMLTKWTYLFFMLGPFIYSIFKALLPKFSKNDFERYSRSGVSFRNIGLCVGTSVVTCGPYYFPILPILIEKTLTHSRMISAHGLNSLLSIDSVFFYPAALWRDMITPLGFILFSIGMVLLIISKNNYKNFSVTWTLIPYLIFTFVILSKKPRFMMPWLVSISLVASFCIGQIQSRKVSDNFLKLIKYFGFLFLIFIAISFFREDLRLKNSIMSSSKENWKINEIISVLEEDIAESRKNNTSSHTPKHLGVIPNHYYINGHTIAYYAALRRLPLSVIKLHYYRGTAYEEFVTKFDRYDYILTKNPLTEISAFQKSIRTMHSYFYSRKDLFQHLQTFNEPDGSEVSIFKRL
ncbi:MAG: glycosyltransferase family 39 protein [Gemmatimonadota bacterium]|nr:MAG: glycosyltransferase family 39 protein [Gemmatimonadota bacterium]